MAWQKNSADQFDLAAAWWLEWQLRNQYSVNATLRPVRRHRWSNWVNWLISRDGTWYRHLRSHPLISIMSIGSDARSVRISGGQNLYICIYLSFTKESLVSSFNTQRRFNYAPLHRSTVHAPLLYRAHCTQQTTLGASPLIPNVAETILSLNRRWWVGGGTAKEGEARDKRCTFDHCTNTHLMESRNWYKNGDVRWIWIILSYPLVLFMWWALWMRRLKKKTCVQASVYNDTKESVNIKNTTRPDAWSPNIREQEYRVPCEISHKAKINYTATILADQPDRSCRLLFLSQPETQGIRKRRRVNISSSTKIDSSDRDNIPNPSQPKDLPVHPYSVHPFSYRLDERYSGVVLAENLPGSMSLLSRD